MSMNKDTERAIDKIRELMKRTKEANASEAEIETAAGMVRKILDEHDLSLEDVQEKEIEDGILKENSSPDVSHNHHVYMGWLAGYLTKAFECSLVFSSRFAGTKKSGRPIVKKVYNFIGYKTDVLSCSYFFEYLRIRLLELANEEICKNGLAGTSRYIFTNSFILGASKEIYGRLKKEEPKNTKSGALMLVKKHAIQKKMPKLFEDRLKTTKCRRVSTRNEGLAAGAEAGRKVTLNHAIDRQSGGNAKGIRYSK